MPDMLVHLLKLPEVTSEIKRLETNGVIIRRANAYEMSAATEFAAKNFSIGWRDEVAVGFANKPISIFIATQQGRIIGFGAYECTRRGFFGPTGVLESERNKGTGKALLLACLHGLRDMGYVYGIIGGVGPAEFYTKCCGAILIEGSTPGIYVDMLKKT
jgi:predicted N-acetyltransferase YhbS